MSMRRASSASKIEHQSMSETDFQRPVTGNIIHSRLPMVINVLRKYLNKGENYHSNTVLII